MSLSGKLQQALYFHGYVPLVSFLNTYFLLVKNANVTAHIHENTTPAVVSWICAVTFAFFTNKKYVFKNETNGKKEFFKVFVSFYGARIATLVMEWLIFFIFCDLLHISRTIITFASQVIIFIANYVLSKLFVFKKKDDAKSNG